MRDDSPIDELLTRQSRMRELELAKAAADAASHDTTDEAAASTDATDAAPASAKDTTPLNVDAASSSSSSSSASSASSTSASSPTTPGAAPARPRRKKNKALGVCVFLVGLLGIGAQLFWDDIMQWSASIPWLTKECPHLDKLNREAGGTGNGDGGAPAASMMPSDVEMQLWAEIVGSDGFMSWETLNKYDASTPTFPILLGMAGKVYDVTKGARFYQKGAFGRWPRGAVASGSER